MKYTTEMMVNMALVVLPEQTSVTEVVDLSRRLAYAFAGALEAEKWVGRISQELLARRNMLRG